MTLSEAQAGRRQHQPLWATSCDQLLQSPHSAAFVLQAVSIVFFTDSWRPDSFYPRIAANRQRGLHTLCLLDIKVKEPSLESLARGRKVHLLLPCDMALRRSADIDFVRWPLSTVLGAPAACAHAGVSGKILHLRRKPVMQGCEREGAVAKSCCL